MAISDVSVRDLYDYWRDWPPAHECLKLGFGIERKSGAAERPISPPETPSTAPIGDFSALVRQIPNGILS